MFFHDISSAISYDVCKAMTHLHISSTWLRVFMILKLALPEHLSMHGEPFCQDLQALTTLTLLNTSGLQEDQIQ